MCVCVCVCVCVDMNVHLTLQISKSACIHNVSVTQVFFLFHIYCHRMASTSRAVVDDMAMASLDGLVRRVQDRTDAVAMWRGCFDQVFIL